MIFIITGPAGVGKSTIAKKLCKKIDRSIYVSLDSLREFVKNGYKTPATFNYDNDLVLQGKLARKSAAHIAKLYDKNGFNVVIDDIVYGEYLNFWQRKLKFRKYKIIVLQSSLKTILKRNGKRKNAALADDVIIYLKKEFDKLSENKNFLTINNNKIETTLKKIIKLYPR